MKLIEENQFIGLGFGFCVFRDLYEKENGERVSVKRSRTFDWKEYKGKGKTYKQIFNETKIS